MIPGNHPFYAYIEETLSLKLDLFPSDPQPSNSTPLMPVEFCDRHLASHLQLQSIQIVPELPRLVTAFGESEIDDYFSVERGLNPELRYASWVPSKIEPLSKKDSPAALYHDNFSSLSSFPAQLYVCPDKDFWKGFAFRVERRLSLSPFITVGSLRIPNQWIEGTEAQISSTALEDMRELDSHGRVLALWHFYPYNDHGEKLLKSMGSDQHFKWDVSSTSASLPTAAVIGHRPPDAQTPLTDAILDGRPGGRRKEAKSSRSRRDYVKPSATRRTADPTKPYRIDYKHYLQRAWSHAAVNDATFIIFSCGRYERIGLRHRQTQTLFLSDLIDPTTTHGLRYGQIQVGLYISIIHDALNRQKMRRRAQTILKGPPAVSDNPTARKRKGTVESGAKNRKRSKIEGCDNSAAIGKPSQHALDKDSVSAFLSSRHMALISFQYGSYHSSSPSSFIRVGGSCAPGYHHDKVSIPSAQKQYPREDYFSLDLLEKVGDGSTGIAYRARATIWTDGDVQLSAAVIVKLVFLAVEGVPGGDYKFLARERVKNEFRVYEHLATNNIGTGTLSVYGLFEDPESGTLALVMEDGGVSLTAREESRTGSRRRITVLSVQERENALGALKAIHSTGVRHRDLRADNIVVNAKEEAFIIDFDMAQLNATSSSRHREYLCLQHILDGKGDTADFYSF